MTKVIKSRKPNSKKMLLYAGLLVGALALSTPKTVYAEDEVLYEETNDDYETEKIEETDIVRDNTVVNPVEEEKQEEKQEEKKEETQEEEKSTVLPDDQQGDEGKNWDPSIKTEEEKKHINEEHHEEEHHEEEHHEEEHHEEEHHEEEHHEEEKHEEEKHEEEKHEEQKPAPKTGMGDIDWTKVFAIVGLGCLGTLGLSSLVTGRKIEEETKSRRR